MAEEPNIIVKGHGITIMIQGPSEQYWGKDLLTMAIIELIDAADTSDWERERYAEEGINDLVTPADQFYNAILSALARHYAVENRGFEDKPVYSVLFDMIADLSNKKRLGTVIKADDWREHDAEPEE